MPVYRDAEHLYECIGGLFDILKKDPVVGPKLAGAKFILQLTYTEPEAQITVDCLNPPAEPGVFVTWKRGPSPTPPLVELLMKGDIAHKFWLGRLNLLVALTMKQMVAKGPITKVLSLLPIIKPAYAIYPQMLKDKGYREMAP
ncbi:MAG: hypothetical protein HYY93_05055 [Planctomycetes bacterium]|nr:hypothetical protein [Planctomycetota bacterium]